MMMSGEEAEKLDAGVINELLEQSHKILEVVVKREDEYANSGKYDGDFYIKNIIRPFNKIKRLYKSILQATPQNIAVWYDLMRVSTFPVLARENGYVDAAEAWSEIDGYRKDALRLLVNEEDKGKLEDFSSKFCKSLINCYASQKGRIKWTDPEDFNELCSGKWSAPGTAWQIEMAINEGADPNARYITSEGVNFAIDSSFICAARNNSHPEAISLLLRYGADIHEDNDAAIIAAAYCNRNPEIVSVLIKNGANIDTRWGSPLANAVYGNRSDIVRLLLENGANINAKSFDNDHTILQSVIEKKVDPEVISELLKHGASTDGVSPEILKDALSAQICRNFDPAPHYWKRTAFTDEIDCGTTPETIYEILRKGVNAKTKNLWLMQAAKICNEQYEHATIAQAVNIERIISLLLQNGADATIEDENGLMPIDQFNYNMMVHYVGGKKYTKTYCQLYEASYKHIDMSFLSFKQ
ncbi:MAG: ankyrin repeat domain-containing protein [Holosporaceae bacterium]|jgi:hypothetical protein|nr:ankyrin repeat domain-containing protein [Holosporaceae bacterium]